MLVSPDNIVSSAETIVQLSAARDSRFIASMATLLAQHSYGRILLHIVTMFGDGEVRWHCAGIAREFAKEKAA